MLTNYERRKYRVRGNVIKNNKSQRPRIVVSKSNKNLYVQLISIDGKVLSSSSTLSLDKNTKVSGMEKAKLVGTEFAKLCLKTGSTKVVFDKGAYAYNGRIKALADSCREAGLLF